MKHSITVIVVTWNTGELIYDLIDTLGDLESACNIIISDNGSTDGTPEKLEECFPSATILRNPENNGFGYGNNRALEHCRTPYVLLLNPDARVDLPSLNKLHVALAVHKEAAAVQPLIRLWDWKYITLSAGTAMTHFGEGYDLRFMHFQKNVGDVPVAIPGVTAAVVLYRIDALREVGGFDENIFMYFEDIDLSNRIRGKGGKFLLIPQAEAFHRSGSSSKRESAMNWELSSSVILMKKFLCRDSDELPRYWKKRERRIRLSSIRRGKSWFRRTRYIADAMNIPVEKIVLDKDVLSDITASRLSLMPYPRPNNYVDTYCDRNESVSPGPGWSIPGNYITGTCGCLKVPVYPGRLGFRVLSLRNSGSVSIRLEDGEVYRYFIQKDDVLDLSIPVPDNCTRIYIVPDNLQQKIRVTDFKYEE